MESFNFSTLLVTIVNVAIWLAIIIALVRGTKKLKCLFKKADKIEEKLDKVLNKIEK